MVRFARAASELKPTEENQLKMKARLTVWIRFKVFLTCAEPSPPTDTINCAEAVPHNKAKDKQNRNRANETNGSARRAHDTTDRNQQIKWTFCICKYLRFCSYYMALNAHLTSVSVSYLNARATDKILSIGARGDSLPQKPMLNFEARLWCCHSRPIAAQMCNTPSPLKLMYEIWDNSSVSSKCCIEWRLVS